MKHRLPVLLAPAAAAAMALATLSPATAAAVDPTPSRVSLMGSLMSELGCPVDWDESCGFTDLTRGPGGVWSLTGTVPAGAYELKVRLNGSWDVNYGAGGAQDGANVPLVLAAPARLAFTWDETSHRIGVAPADPAGGLTSEDRALAGNSLRKDLTKEQFYFVMADRFNDGNPANNTGGFGGGKLQNGYDPSDKAFFHGGDLKGIIDKLDYIQGLGTTAIWMTPSFKNKPVQGAGGSESAGYHGYWVTDFTQIDPHLGTNAELKQLIDLAHARGIKVFFDIITNHTADVLDYDPSAYTGPADNESVPYVSKAEAPYLDAAGTPFDDRDFTMGDTFPSVGPGTFPYATKAKPGEEDVKVPAWLNDPRNYHNRGTSTFAGEDGEYGDFPGGDRQALDDLWTERPEVVKGMIDVYSTWVREAGVDGFRIDTVKNVDLDFWKRFGPALQSYAASVGNDDFFMFGEVYDADPRVMSRYTTAGKLQATVDFGFQGSGSNFAKGRPTTELRDFFAADDYYTDGDSNVYSAPTFLGNHDMGRIGMFLSQDGAKGDELLKRDQLAHELMYLVRGQPVVYYGDEQGFVGDGGDQDAREDMFASKVATYNDNTLIGTKATTAQANFDTAHPMYRTIASLSALRKAHPALADGAQVHRYASDQAGIYAFSRMDPTQRVEYVVATNNATTAKTATFPTAQPGGAGFTHVWPLTGRRFVKSRTAPDGQLRVTVPPLSSVVLKADAALPAPTSAPTATFTTPVDGGTVGGRAEIGVRLPAGSLAEVTFLSRPVGTSSWAVLGTDDNAPYRVFDDVTGRPAGTLLEYRAVVRAGDQLSVTTTSASVGAPSGPAADAGAAVPPKATVQPERVTVPGSHGAEIGCADDITGAGGDWEPGCTQAGLTLDPADGIWKATLDVPAGSYEFKAALNGTWEVNYGQGGALNGSNIAYTTQGGPLQFLYDPRTKVVSNTAIAPVVTAVGDFQKALGCANNDDPSCLVTWLQDGDGDGVAALSISGVPAGDHTVRASTGGKAGAPVSFTVPSDGLVVTFAYDTTTKALSATSGRPGANPDLGSSRARQVSAQRVDWDVQDDVAASLTYRLHWGPKDALAVDSEGLGGRSIPLIRVPDARLPLFKVSAGADVLLVDDRYRPELARIASAGQVAVAAYDRLGRLVDATALQTGGS